MHDTLHFVWENLRTLSFLHKLLHCLIYTRNHWSAPAC